MNWFESHLYVFRKHWLSVDNYRIDKFLMMMRFMTAEALSFLKSADYKKEEVEWLN